MNSRDSILLSALHSAGCTHRDFRKIFLLSSDHIEKVYEDILAKNPLYSNIIPKNRYEKICENLAQTNISERENFLTKNNIKIINFFEAEYPESLKHAYQYPFILYAKGNIQPQEISIGVVGSRKNTAYGKNVLEKIFTEIPYKNISIISGGAYGIDSLAHENSLKKWLHTVAVFGCGIDVVYPATNKILFEKILENNGGLLSSFPIGTPPDAFNFPIRNEIVAGLSNAILIPEAGVKSGTLITARLALEQGKEIFAVPWDIFRKTSEGCNQLISNGEAKCTLSANDILENFYAPSENLSLPIEEQNFPAVEKNFSSENARKIFEAIQNGNNTTDSMISATGMAPHEISIELSLLEIDGHIRFTPLWLYECIF